MIFPAICPSKTLHFPANFTPKPKLHFSERSPATPNPTTLEFPGPKTVVASQSRRLATTRESQNWRILETIRVGFTSSVSEAVACPRWPCLHSNRYKRDHWLGQLTQGYNLIAVSGRHGKSTTASMLAYVLDAMDDSLTAVVGAHMPQFSGGNIILGDGQNFVLEAEEYDGCFLGLSPYIAVVTNLDWEHVDIFQNGEAVKATFHKFLNLIRVGGHLILCGDSQGAYSLLTDVKQAIASDTLSGLMHSR